MVPHNLANRIKSPIHDAQSQRLLCRGLRIHLSRKQRRFRSCTYAVVMVFNFLARISWAVALGPHQIRNMNLHHLMSFIEIIRRLVWGVLRIENVGFQHVSDQKRGQINDPLREAFLLESQRI